MNKTLTLGHCSRRNIFLLAGIALVLAVSWSSYIDSHAHTMINDAIFDAGVIFASARFVNGLVSVLQSVEVGVITFSVSPGEMLDPINDLVEQFSTVLTVALASLGLQKMLLYITDSVIFNVVLTLSALMAAWATVVSSDYSRVFVRIFFTLALLRMSLAFIILANAAVDGAFLQKSTDEGLNDFKILESSLTSAAGSVGGIENNDELRAFEESRHVLDGEAASVEAELEVVKAELNEIRSRRSDLQGSKSITSRFSLFSDDPELAALDAEIDRYGIRVKELEISRRAIGENIKEVDEQIECLNTRAEGGTCSFREWIGSKTSVLDINGQLKMVMGSIEKSVDGILNLIMLVTLKSILLPLLFLWTVYLSIKCLWREKAV